MNATVFVNWFSFITLETASGWDDQKSLAKV